VAANFALIPVWGIMGPPWAAFAAYCATVIVAYFAGRRYFPVPYELRRLGIIAATALVLSVPALAGWILPGAWSWLAYRLSVLIAFPLCLLSLGFFLPEEKAKFLSLLSKAPPQKVPGTF